MNLVGKRVLHKAKFGEGIITCFADNRITVKFDSDEAIRLFEYPTCFQSFLELIDENTASAMQSVIAENEKVKRERQEKQHQEVEAHNFQRRLQEQERSAVRGGKTIVLRPFPTVNIFCEQYEKTLIAEIAYLKTNGGKRQRIFDGKLIENKNGSFIYSFEADCELNYPDGTQITLWSGTSNIPASIVNCEDFTLVISSATDLSRDVSSIEFSAEPWRLINSLIERLNHLKDTASMPIVQALVCDGFKKIQYGKEITKGQENACQMSLSQPITFVWGPPGTGKTETLATIALKHISQGHRVLMLSYSNVSVDGAIMRVNKHDNDKRAGKLVRYGYPRDKDLLHHEYLTTYNLALHNHPDLLKERTSLTTERKGVSRVSPRYVEIGARLAQIRAHLAEEEKASVRSASFVATTVSKAVVDKVIYEGKFDTVIFDEASMAYIPQIVFAASLATKHFICMGDFEQLPPIVQNSSDSILNADIFQYCGITSAVEVECGHEWLCLLDTQHRMHPRISDFASINMYHSLLRSADNMERERSAITHSLPLFDQPLGIADLSGMMSVCTQTTDSSRINPLSALMAFGLALQAADKYDVGIITPYNAQSRLLHAMARDAAEQCPALRPISCATVHQFQGSEKDVIIYDAVDCYRQRFPGTLLTSTNNNYANRLFNVALTRAKGKFVAIANVSYMENKGLSTSLMFSKLINRYKHTPQSIEGSEFTKAFLNPDYPCYQWINAQNGTELFISDLVDAKREIRIDIPAEMSCVDIVIGRICTALKQAKNGGVKVVIRAEDKATLPNELKPFAIENKYIANPITLIDRQIVWFGEPLSNANFKSEGTVLPTRYRPIIRFDGKHTANSLYGFLEMNRTVDQGKLSSEQDSENDGATFAAYISSNMRCNKCGKPLKLIKNKGKFFLGCSGYPACKSSEMITVDMIEKYFSGLGRSGKHCPQDHTSLEAKLGPYGVFVQCCGLARHKFKLDEI